MISTERVLQRSSYIRAPADVVWNALVDPDLTVQYVGSRVRSTWKAGEPIVYEVPGSDQKFLEGTILEIEPGRRVVFECRWLFTPEVAADEPHREMFEVEPMGEITKLTATFDQWPVNSAAYGVCDMARTGDTLKYLLETGGQLFGEIRLSSPRHRPRKIPLFLTGRLGCRGGSPGL